MRLRDLRYGMGPAWPPSLGGPYNPDSSTFPQAGEGILKSAALPADGPGVNIAIEFDGGTYSARMLWDGDSPSPDEVVAALGRCIGRQVSQLGDAVVYRAPEPN